MLIACLLFVSCQEVYDDTEIREQIASLQERVTNLEEWQKSINSNITSLQAIVEALEGKDYVTDVTTNQDGSGYVINFEKSGSISIKNGSSPKISVGLYEGIYYWTLDGEWILDNLDNMIPVTGNDGKDAIAPKVRINDTTNEWEISTDNGVTWSTTSIKATGEDGKDGLTPMIRINNDTNEWEISIDNGANWSSTGVNATGKDGTSAISPLLRINKTTNEWEISTDNGINWVTTRVNATGADGVDGTDGKDGVDGTDGKDGEDGSDGKDGVDGTDGKDGDSFFKSVDNSNPDFLILVLADDNIIYLPKTQDSITISIGDNNSSNSTILVPVGDSNIKINLSSTFKENSYSSIIATVTSDGYISASVATRAATERWKVNVIKPTFTADGTYNDDARLYITPPADATLNEKAILEVSVVDTNGVKTTSTRIVQRRAMELLDKVYDEDRVIGIVYRITNGGENGMIMSVSQQNEGEVKWSTEEVDAILLDSETNGTSNMFWVNDTDKDFMDYPIFEWAHKMNIANNPDFKSNQYSMTEEVKGVWYIPSKKELRALYAGLSGYHWIDYVNDETSPAGSINGKTITDWGDDTVMPNYSETQSYRVDINTILGIENSLSLSNQYWSSSEISGSTAWSLNFSNGTTSSTDKTNSENKGIRAIMAF